MTDTRTRVRRLIEAEPGIHKSDLQRRVGRAWGTVGYHLDRLLDGGQARSLRHGREHLFFPATMSEERMRWVLALRQAHAEAVLRTLAARPGLTANAVGAAIGASPRTVRRRLAAFEELGLVAPREGNPVRHFLDPAVADALVDAAPGDLPGLL